MEVAEEVAVAEPVSAPVSDSQETKPVTVEGESKMEAGDSKREENQEVDSNQKVEMVLAKELDTSESTEPSHLDMSDLVQLSEDNSADQAKVDPLATEERETVTEQEAAAVETAKVAETTHEAVAVPTSEAVQYVEYVDSPNEDETLVVIPSGNAKQVIVQTDEGEQTVMMQEVTDESGQVYLVPANDDVVMVEDDKDEDDANDTDEAIEEEVGDVTEPLPPQVVKTVPSHILGRRIDNPSVDPFRNGKTPPKPRLGVKIPYRNLTSQIVSKQEIANEIMNRSRRHNRPTPGGQNYFAKKLTQTLAKKIAPKEAELAETEEKLNNSDLLAILEGDDDPAVKPPPPVVEERKVEMTRELEREIALKQLSELPDDDAPLPPPPPVITQKKKTKEDKERDRQIALKQIEDEVPIKKRKSQSDEPEPDLTPSRFNANMPIKTYSRMVRKTSEEVPSPSPTNSPKVTVAVVTSTQKIDLPKHPNNYVTKSSRVIKKKIIWDPDEANPKKFKADLQKVKTESSPKEEAKKEVRKVDKNDKIVEVKLREKPTKPKFEIVRKLERISRVKSERKVVTAPASPVKKITKVEAKNDSKADLEKKNPKRYKSEVDKLLMDEGAVNMLYSLNTAEENEKKRPNKSLKSKTNELLNDLQTTTDKSSPKTLRKKELVVKRKTVTPGGISRQQSKDSIRSSIQSPPLSPGMLEASRIIRRHSSSSFSSDEEEYDDEEEGDDGEELEEDEYDFNDEKPLSAREIETPRKKLRRTEETAVAKPAPVKAAPVKNPTVKLTQLKAVIKSGPVKVTPAKAPPKVVKTPNETKKVKESPAATQTDDKYKKYKTFSVKRLDQLVKILLTPNGDENAVYMTVEMMQELQGILKEFESDSECNVVAITSEGSSFTRGIKFDSLIANKEATRKNLAKKLAANVREFLLTLANFPKVLVAGVQGHVVGLGVTMLPLFDVVVVEDAASFTMPYATLGCIAEGGSLLTLPHLSQNVLVSELLFSCRTLTAEDAFRYGLVTKVLQPEKFQSELASTLSALSKHSAQFMEATKKQMKERTIADVTTALNAETDTLVQQWTSAECQRNFAVAEN